MTASEALKIVAERGLNIEGTAHDEVMVQIKSALEKQIPKKPVIEKGQKIFYIQCGSCPECKGRVYSSANCFCHKCGQAIDWSEEE